MTKQPEALRLADNLGHAWTLLSDQQKAASELRRLHEENEKLKTVPMEYRRMEFNAQLQEENKRLHEVNQELLEALKEVLAVERFSNRPPETVMQAEEKLARIRAATANAEAAIAKGEQP